MEQEVIQEYQKYEKLIRSDKSLSQMEIELKKMQQNIVNKKHNGIECQKDIDDYLKMKEEFDSHPIVLNYLMLKEEVNRLILFIQDDINQQLKKIID